MQKVISVAILGKPNAGKSSLLNQLIKQKISIVTPKIQTTRSIITGIITIKDTQIIILDTPGIFSAKKQLERAMVRCAWSSVRSVDLVILMVDSTKKIDQEILQISDKLKQLGISPIYLLNKIDIKSKHQNDLYELIQDNKYIMKISALNGKGVDEILQYIMSQAQYSEWIYDKDEVTNLPLKFLAAEITREQLFLNMHQELPYNLTVQTESLQENSNKSITIHQIIIVSKMNYKTMILGKHGNTIKAIGSNARLEIEKIFDLKIHLFLFVKVRQDWDKKPQFYQNSLL